MKAPRFTVSTMDASVMARMVAAAGAPVLVTTVEVEVGPPLVGRDAPALIRSAHAATADAGKVRPTCAEPGAPTS